MVDRATAVLAIDPGPRTSGLVIYDLPRNGGPGSVRHSVKAASWADVVREVRWLRGPYRTGELIIACERVTPGQSSWSLVQTSEVIGRLMQLVEDLGDNARLAVPLSLLSRREVLMALRVSGPGAKRDSLVRACLMEMHGGERAVSIGTKRAPGPLHGVASHAWAALAVACAHRILQRETAERAAAHITQ